MNFLPNSLKSSVMKTFHLILLFAGFTLPLFAQTGLQPEGRVSGHLIYSYKLKSLLLIDGYQIHLDSPRNDVWKWDGKSWTIIPAAGPTSKSLSAAARHSGTDNAYVFGGVGTKNYQSLKGDIWSFDGTRWTVIDADYIGTRDHHEMVYADHIDGFVVYGGQNERRQNDTVTWILRGLKFKAMHIDGPGPLVHFAMAYDVSRKKVVLYGGFSKRNMSDQLWEFDGTEWKRINANAPGPRAWHAMAYDRDRKTVVLHGGVTFMGGANEREYATDTWAWDGRAWKKVASGGPASILPALGYDENRKVLVLFGGSGDDNTMFSALWELHATKWSKIADGGTWKWTDNEYRKMD
jgi:hypothetical protein